MKIKTLILILLSIITLFSCTLVFNSLADCPQGVDFYFYSQTPCANEASFPKNIKQVKIFVFDESNTLKAVLNDKDINLKDSLRFRHIFKGIGKFHFVAWAGEDLSVYDFSDYKINQTKRDEISLSLALKEGVILKEPKALYFCDDARKIEDFGGKNKKTELKTLNNKGEAIGLEDKFNKGSIFDLVAFNLQEVTYSFDLSMSIINTPEPNADNYELIVEDSNNVYDMNGNIVSTEKKEYHIPIHTEGEYIKAKFLLMKLRKDSNTTLILRQKKDGFVMTRQLLVKNLLLNPGVISGEGTNVLECKHFYDINFRIETAMSISGTVLGWNLVWRNVEL